ncbi:MAG: ABC transporter ATP-binding protein [Spirochaetales bacterium]|nr:ABC transporter ATP-binding protein [Spirochaetales bacterium]
MLKNYRRLGLYLKAHGRQYIFGILFLIVTDAAQLYIPQLVRKAIDLAASGFFGMKEILFAVLPMIGLALLVAFGRYCWRYFINGAARQIEAEIRGDLYNHLQSLSATFYARQKTGDLMAHLTNDVNAIRMATGIGFALGIDGVMMIIAVLVIMIDLNSTMALLSLSPLPVLTIGVIFFSRIVGEQFKKVQEGFSDLSDTVQESFSGVRVLKTFVKEAVFVKRFVSKNLDYSERNLKLVRSWGFFFPAVSLLAGLSTVLFIIFGGRTVMEGLMSPGEFTAFFAYLQMLIWPLLGAGFTINMLKRAGASLERINAIMDEEPDIASPPAQRMVTSQIKGGLAIRNLTFTYPGADSPALEGIDLDLPAGRVLGILGKTGSGKSTLVNLIPRLYDPPPGSVFLDGIDVREYDLTVLRSAVSVVPQDSFLFSASIRANIGFGNPRADEQLLKKAADVSTISRDFSMFPDGWDTVVGERGVSLSGGQKQRVAISRALAADSSIVIFDDALSSVDTETEDAILSDLPGMIEGKTFIIIAHRISTLKTADVILVLENGRIIQQGSHEELVRTPGFYADVYRLQQLEESIRKER